MADSSTKETVVGMSTNPEATYNGIVTSAASFFTLKTRENPLVAPDTEKTDDSGEIGNAAGVGGGEFPTTQKSGFAIPNTFTIANTVNSGTFAVQLRRFLGAADATPAGGDIVEAGVAFRHKFAMLPNNTVAGKQLPSSTFAISNNGLDYLYAGCGGNTLQIGQQGRANPTFSIGYVGSGLTKRIRDITGPVFGTIAAPVDQSPFEMYGAESGLEFTDDGGLYSPVSARRMVNFSTTINNNLDTEDTLAGAPRVDPTDKRKGWYRDRLLHGDRTGGAEMRVKLDDTMREFADARNNTPITGFAYIMVGDDFSASATSPKKAHEVRIKFGKCFFRAVRPNDDRGGAVLDIGVFLAADNVQFGIVRAEVINGVATAIV
jgi:hypothetical protein